MTPSAFFDPRNNALRATERSVAISGVFLLSHEIATQPTAARNDDLVSPQE